MKQSKFLSLNFRDVLRGFLVAFLAFLFDWLQTSFVPQLNISPDVKIMLVTGLAYLSKNFFTKAEEK